MPHWDEREFAGLLELLTAFIGLVLVSGEARQMLPAGKMKTVRRPPTKAT
jgi:hypothetical protein